MKVAITGVTGRLGGALARHHRALGNEVLALDRQRLDVSRPETLADSLKDAAFDVLLHPAAMTILEACEDEPDLAYRVNAVAPGILAEVCAARSLPMVHVSTDYVFAGDRAGECVETDPTKPINHYGRTKLAGEEAVLKAHPHAWVARVSWLFGPERPGFVEAMLERAAKGEPLAAIDDKVSCPTYVDDAAIAFDRLLEVTDTPGGIVHVCNPGPTSWHGIATEAFRIRGGTQPEIARQQLVDMKAFRAARPVHTAMAVDHLRRLTGYQMRPWQEALAVYLKKVRWIDSLG